MSGVEVQTRVASYPGLLALLRQDQVLFRAEPGALMVRIPTQQGELEGELELRWAREDGVIHFIHALPFEVPPERLGALALAIAAINHALPVPGFGLNTGQRRVYLRVAAPAPLGDGLDPREIRALFRYAVRTAADFWGPLRRVAEEGADPTAVVADATVEQILRGAP